MSSCTAQRLQAQDAARPVVVKKVNANEEPEEEITANVRPCPFPVPADPIG